MRFSSETASAKLHPLTTSINYKKIQILYRNQLENEEEEESELRSKKEMEHYEVRIARQKDKQLEYRLEIPILRGLKTTKNAKASELFFTFSYCGSEGNCPSTQECCRCRTDCSR